MQTCPYTGIQTPSSRVRIRVLEILVKVLKFYIPCLFSLLKTTPRTATSDELVENLHASYLSVFHDQIRFNNYRLHLNTNLLLKDTKHPLSAPILSYSSMTMTIKGSVTLTLRLFRPYIIQTKFNTVQRDQYSHLKHWRR